MDLQFFAQSPQDNIQIAIDLMRNTMYIILLLGMPLLGVGLVVGLAISVFQAATSIQEQTLTFVPKILAVVIYVVATFPWMVSKMMDYTRDLIIRMPTMFG